MANVPASPVVVYLTAPARGCVERSRSCASLRDGTRTEERLGCLDELRSGENIADGGRQPPVRPGLA